MIHPLPLLELELFKYEKSLKKSKEALEKDLIPENVHEDHKSNLEPIIQEYKDAIHCLKIFGK